MALANKRARRRADGGGSGADRTNSAAPERPGGRLGSVRPSVGWGRRRCRPQRHRTVQPEVLASFTFLRPFLGRGRAIHGKTRNVTQIQVDAILVHFRRPCAISCQKCVAYTVGSFWAMTMSPQPRPQGVQARGCCVDLLHASPRSLFCVGDFHKGFCQERDRRDGWTCCPTVGVISA